MTKIKYLFIGHSLVVPRQYKFVEQIENAMYIVPSQWGNHVYLNNKANEILTIEENPNGQKMVNDTAIVDNSFDNNSSNSIFDYSYDLKLLDWAIETYDPEWIGGFIEPYSNMAKYIISKGRKSFAYAFENLSNNIISLPSRLKNNFRFIKEFDHIFCGNPHADRFMKVLGAKKTSIQINVGVDSNHFSVYDNKRSDKGLFMARDIPEKGWDLINTQSTITGTPVFKPSSFVTYEELPRLYNGFRYYIHACYRTGHIAEQFGYTILEALMCGLYVMVADYGSTDYWFKDIPGVVMYDPLKPESINEAFKKIERMDKGKNFKGRNRVLNFFSNKSIAKKTVEALK